MTDYEFFLQQRELEIKYEKKGIRSAGITAGICIVASIIIQYLFGALLLFPPALDAYLHGEIFESCFIALNSIFSIGLPFAIGGIYLQNKTGTEIFKFNKPAGMSLSILAVPFGFFICLIANYVTSVIATAASTFGVELSLPETSTPSGFFGRFAYIIAIAVVPALVEELGMRGAVMQPLRKYGDTFAIVVSAVVFAILHGNLIQAPFAFMAGLAIGYAVCLTESLWTGVMIHFANNLYSVFAGFLVEDVPDVEMQNKIYLIILFTLLAISVVGSAGFMIVKGRQKLQKKSTALDAPKKAAVFFLNPAMIIAIIIMIKVTLNYISLK